MADEQSGPPFNKPSPVPKEFAWPTLLKLDGEPLEAYYRRTLQELGARGGPPSMIFRGTWHDSNMCVTITPC